jgi:TPR repeat protein
LYDDGKGVKKNINKALELYKKACDEGEELGCENYGKLKSVFKK